MTEYALQAPFPWFGLTTTIPVICLQAMTTLERFWSKVEKTRSCWIWTGSKRSKGYGAFVYSRDDQVIQGRAHRYSWEVHKGNIPAGLCVLHKCDVPACVNPEHLWLGTRRDNNLDMCQKGRHVPGGTHCGKGNYERGVNHHNSRLNPTIVRKIRQDAQALSFSKIAAKYRIGITHAWRIVNKKVWKDVE